MQAWMMMRSELALLVTFVIGTGCATQTIRAVPAKTAPETERIAAWEELRPDYVSDKPTLTGRELRLRNGVSIFEPSALLPALEPRSRADELLRAYVRSSSVRDSAAPVALGHLVASAALMALTFYTPPPVSPVSIREFGLFGEGQVWVFVTALICAGVGVVHGGLWALLTVVSNTERDRVYDEYESSLRARLAIPDSVR